MSAMRVATNPMPISQTPTPGIKALPEEPPRLMPILKINSNNPTPQSRAINAVQVTGTRRRESQEKGLP